MNTSKTIAMNHSTEVSGITCVIVVSIIGRDKKVATALNEVWPLR